MHILLFIIIVIILIVKRIAVIFYDVDVDDYDAL